MLAAYGDTATLANARLTDSQPTIAEPRQGDRRRHDHARLGRLRGDQLRHAGRRRRHGARRPTRAPRSRSAQASLAAIETAATHDLPAIIADVRRALLTVNDDLDKVSGDVTELHRRPRAAGRQARDHARRGHGHLPRRQRHARPARAGDRRGGAHDGRRRGHLHRRRAGHHRGRRRRRPPTSGVSAARMNDGRRAGLRRPARGHRRAQDHARRARPRPSGASTASCSRAPARSASSPRRACRNSSASPSEAQALVAAPRPHRRPARARPGPLLPRRARRPTSGDRHAADAARRRASASGRCAPRASLAALRLHHGLLAEQRRPQPRRLRAEPAAAADRRAVRRAACSSSPSRRSPARSAATASSSSRARCRSPSSPTAAGSSRPRRTSATCSPARFANTGRFGFVTTDTVGPLPDFTLLTDVETFEAEMRPPGGAPARVVVSMTLTHRPRRRRPPGREPALHADRRRAGHRRPPIVAAFEAANSALLRDAPPGRTTAMTGAPGSDAGQAITA